MNWGKLCNRISLWGALLLVVLGLGTMASLVSRALGPGPGGGLYLMGMPCVAVPTLLAAIVTVSVTRVGPEGLSRWEWQLGRCVGWPALVLAAILATVG